MTRDELASRCDCEWCDKLRRVESVIARRDPDELVALVEELYTDNFNVALDVEYHEVILDGSWPGARDILTRALAKCPQE